MNAKVDVTNIKIGTERMLLRPFKTSDLEDLFEYVSVPGVGENAGWPHHKSIDITKQILSMFIEEKKTFAIVYKDNNKVIGSLGIEKYSNEDKLTEFTNYIGREIGYVLSKDYWGKGLATEAVKAVINYLFEKENYDFLVCSYYDFNNRSKRVQEKCGFKPYRKVICDTMLGTKEPGILQLLINPSKQIKLEFSHPETLIYKD